MPRVLWLCSWYPNKVHPFEGDFVQRYAQAVSLYNHVDVLKITPDPDGSGVINVTEKPGRFPGLTETRIYYPKGKSLPAAILSHYRWVSLFKKAVRHYIAEKGRPDLVHVQIPFKSGLIGQWLKKKHGVPFVVTEHWGGYNTVVANNFNERPYWFRQVIKSSFHKAAATHMVSDYLGKQVNKYCGKLPYTVLHNVVDTAHFYYGEKPAGEKFECIHISNGAPVKNVEGLMNAFQQLPAEDFQLTVMGLPDQLIAAWQKQFPFVKFIAEQPHAAVAAQLRKAHLLLIFSDAENSPCIIGEALCTGTPVVATDVGGIAELLSPGNGILIQPRDEEGLRAAIREIKQHYEQYDLQQIARTAQSIFAYEVLGKAMTDWYGTIDNIH